MGIAEIIRKFCEEHAEKYSYYENYSGRGIFGKKCVGIIVNNGDSYTEMLIKLTAYLDDHVEELGEDALDRLEGFSVDELGMDTIVYFPRMES